MGIDSMRIGGGRCPPVLFGVLLIVCIMMICNWWTLSSTNLELLRQIDELNEQIKISVEERDQCVTQRGIIENRLKTCQDNARTAQVKLSQIDDSLSTCKKELESHQQIDDALSTCKKELESYQQIEIAKTATLEALRVDKKAITAQLETEQEENKKMKEEIKKVKDQLEKLKLSMNAPPQIPAEPIAHFLEKSVSNNKTALNAAINSQVNAPFNAVNAVQNGEPQDFPEKDDNAAEVDGNNAIDPELNLNLMSDPKERNTQQ